MLNYVVVKFAGSNVDPENQLNGIAFQGVGSGTEVDYVQVHNNLDDGVEFFGGTVNAKHMVLTGNADDSLDWTDGWQGSIQYLIIDQPESLSADKRHRGGQPRGRRNGHAKVAAAHRQHDHQRPLRRAGHSPAPGHGLAALQLGGCGQ